MQVACSPTCVVGENISWQRTQVGAFHRSLNSIWVRPFHWTGVFILPKGLSHLLFDSILQMSFIIMSRPCHENQPDCWTCSTSYWPSIQPLVSQWSRPWLILTLRLVVYCCCSWLPLGWRLMQTRYQLYLLWVIPIISAWSWNIPTISQCQGNIGPGRNEYLALKVINDICFEFDKQNILFMDVMVRPTMIHQTNLLQKVPSDLR